MKKKEIKRAVKAAERRREAALKDGNILKAIQIEQELDALEFISGK